METVLVTGCNGTVGRHISRSLLKAGYRVIGVSLDKQTQISHSSLTYISLDISDVDALRRVLVDERCDVLVHLAALVHVRSRNLSFADYSRVNYRASEQLFREAINSGVRRVLFASTIEVYGHILQEQVIDEDMPCRPESDYARTKLLAEESLAQIANESSTAYAIMRLAPVYAVEFRLNLDKRLYVLPHVGYYLSQGNYRFGVCSVHNISHFVLRWLESVSPISGVFNLADERSYPIKALLAYERHVGRCKYTVRLPFSLCLAGAAVLQTALSLVGRQPGMLSVENVRKLVRSTEWETRRAQQAVGPLPWTLENTLGTD